MSNQSNPNQAEPGKGAAGNQWAVQTAQPTKAVNPPDTIIPSNADLETNQEQLQAAESDEKNSDIKTTDGYVVDETGRMKNFAVEPQMYVDEK